MEHISAHLKEHQNLILHGFDPVSSGGFTQVPNCILKSKKLSLGAKFTYALLLSYAWQKDLCFPGQETLAADMGVTDRSIRNHIRDLEQAGYLKTEQRGLGKTNMSTPAEKCTVATE